MKSKLAVRAIGKVCHGEREPGKEENGAEENAQEFGVLAALVKELGT